MDLKEASVPAKIKPEIFAKFYSPFIDLNWFLVNQNNFKPIKKWVNICKICPRSYNIKHNISWPSYRTSPGGSQERVLEDGPRGWGPEKGKGYIVGHIVGSLSKDYTVEMSWGGSSSCRGDHKGESKYGQRVPKIGHIQRKVSSFAQHKVIELKSCRILPG